MITPTRLFALFVTVIAASMTAVAAIDRGGNTVDRALLVSMSVAICLGAHLIPALSRRAVAAWILWAACLLGTVYGHVTFFTHSSLRAGDVRAQQSTKVIGKERQIKVIEAALAAIKARPVSVVAADLAVATTSRERGALRAEVGEAKRAATLRDELVRLSGDATEAAVTGSDDPVTARLIEVTGSNAASVTLAINLGFSILLELLGSFLWLKALQVADDRIAVPVHNPHRVTETLLENEGKDAVEPVVDPIVKLVEGVRAGKCRIAVADIRSFLGVGQNKAMELRRILLTMPEFSPVAT